MEEYGFNNNNANQNNDQVNDNNLDVNAFNAGGNEPAADDVYTIHYRMGEKASNAQSANEPAAGNEAPDPEVQASSTVNSQVYTQVQPSVNTPVQPPVNTSEGFQGYQPNGGFYSQSSQPAGPTYYKENYKKAKGRKSNILQLVLVAVMSSILGGGIVFAAIQFVSPALSPAIRGFLSENGVKTQDASSTSGTADNGIYKKVEITKSDSAVSAVYDKVSPSIVGIRTTATSQDFFLGQQESSGEGSGIIIKSDGYILTNYHVIESAINAQTNTLSKGAKIEVILPDDKDKSYAATVVGKDSKSDLAVLKIDAGKALPAAELGDSDKLKQGELAVAIGNPGGLEYMGSVTAGIVSGLNRTITTEDGKTLTLIQTDAAINPGNSGGALCNSQGQVIGINTIKITATGFEGLGFAIPINHAKEVADNLIQYKYIKGRPLIGISIKREIDEATSKQYGVPEGVMVGDVTPFGAAEKAGIQGDDIITKFDGQAINTYAKLEELKNKHKPGDSVNVEIYRYADKATKTVTIVLDEDKS